MLLDYINSKNLKRCIITLILFSSLLSTTVFAEIVQGKHYKKLPDQFRYNAQLSQIIAKNPDKINIMFFFSYACYWCGKLDKDFDTWAETQTENIKVEYYPVVYSNPYKVLAKGFYIAQELENSAEMDDKIFDAIHSDRKNLAKESNLKEFFIENNMPEEKFNKLYNSFSIERKVQFADLLSRGLDIHVTPQIVIQGPENIYVTSWEMAVTKNKLFEVINYLLEKESIVKNKPKISAN